MWVGGSSESNHAVEVEDWVVNTVAPIEREYQCGNWEQKTYLGEGSTRQKIATHAKNQLEKARLAARVRGEETVGPGRKRTEGRGAL